MITGSITLEQAKQHLRVTHNIDDAYIADIIPVAYQLIADELDRELTDDICLMATGKLSSSLNHAAKLIIGDLYVNREAQQQYQLHENAAITRLLNKYRRLGV